MTKVGCNLVRSWNLSISPRPAIDVLKLFWFKKKCPTNGNPYLYSYIDIFTLENFCTNRHQTNTSETLLKSQVKDKKPSKKVSQCKLASIQPVEVAASSTSTTWRTAPSPRSALLFRRPSKEEGCESESAALNQKGCYKKRALLAAGEEDFGLVGLDHQGATAL